MKAPFLSMDTCLSNYWPLSGQQPNPSSVTTDELNLVQRWTLNVDTPHWHGWERKTSFLDFYTLHHNDVSKCNDAWFTPRASSAAALVSRAPSSLLPLLPGPAHKVACVVCFPLLCHSPLFLPYHPLVFDKLFFKFTDLDALLYFPDSPHSVVYKMICQGSDGIKKTIDKNMILIFGGLETGHLLVIQRQWPPNILTKDKGENNTRLSRKRPKGYLFVCLLLGFLILWMRELNPWGAWSEASCLTGGRKGESQVTWPPRRAPESQISATSLKKHRTVQVYGTIWYMELFSS